MTQQTCGHHDLPGLLIPHFGISITTQRPGNVTTQRPGNVPSKQWIRGLIVTFYLGENNGFHSSSALPEFPHFG